MLYLEDFLATLKDRTNVLVKLSNYKIYEAEDGGIFATIQDHCGNHYAKNWMSAINLYCLHQVFVVKDFSIDYSSYMETPQWTIVLANVRDTNTNLLDEVSNRFACLHKD